MTHAERMAALVAALNDLKTEHKFYRDNAPPDAPLGRDLLNAQSEALHKAGCARPSIALAAEGMKALKEWRECERRMNNVSNDTNDYHNAYSALVTAWKRIDKLLAQWEEGT